MSLQGFAENLSLQGFAENQDSDAGSFVLTQRLLRTQRSAEKFIIKSFCFSQRTLRSLRWSFTDKNIESAFLCWACWPFGKRSADPSTSSGWQCYRMCHAEPLGLCRKSG